MKSIRRNQSNTLQLDLTETPDDDPTVTISHEWGNTVVEDLATTNVSDDIWSVALTSAHTISAGVHKLRFNYEVSGDEAYKDLYINIFSPYIDKLTFFNNHPELEDEFDDVFNDMETKTRGVINTYCGQDFDFRSEKTITLDGSDSRNLYLPIRLESFSTVTSRYDSVGGVTTDDISSYVQVHPESKYFLRMKDTNNKFGDKAEYIVEGDWGWAYVPQNVTDAADYIIADLMNDDSNYRQHGVEMAYWDSHRLKFSDSIFGSTGNLDADVLLMDYTLFIMTLI